MKIGKPSSSSVTGAMKRECHSHTLTSAGGAVLVSASDDDDQARARDQQDQCGQALMPWESTSERPPCRWFGRSATSAGVEVGLRAQTGEQNEQDLLGDPQYELHRPGEPDQDIHPQVGGCGGSLPPRRGTS
jgi:hypothetical protein